MNWYPGNYAIRIAADTESAILTAGAAEVFVVDRASGERRHLFSIETGGPILPLPISPGAPWEIVAITLEPTCVSPEGMEPEWAAIVALDNWLSAIGESLGRLRPVADALTVEEGGILLQTGQRVCIAEGVNFVRLGAGDGSLCGVPIEAGSTVALVPGLWLEAGSPGMDSDWEVLNNADASIHSAVQVMRSTLDLVVPVFLEILREDQENRDREEALRLSRKRENESEVTTRAVDTLVLRSTEDRRAAGDPLVDAAQAVVGNTRIASRPGLRNVRDLAEASGLRSRRVQLSGSWSKNENGPLLGYRKNGAPVALLPVDSGYELFDPAANTRIRVNAEVAADLKPGGFMLYDPPPQDLSGWRAARFLFARRAKDLRTLILAGVGAAVLSAVLPVGTSLLIGSAIPDSDRDMIRQVALAMLVAAVGAALLLVVQATAIMRVQISAFQRLQASAWDHLLRLSPTFFRRFTVGQLRLRADGFTRTHQLLTADSVRSLLAGAAAVFSLAVVFWYSPAVGVIAMLCAVGAAGITWVGSHSTVRAYERSQRADEFLSGFVLQAIGGVTKLRVAGAANRTFLQWARNYSEKQIAGNEIRELRDRVRVSNLIWPHVGVTLGFLWYLDHPLALGSFLAAQAALLTFLLTIGSAGDTWTGLLLVANLWKRSNSILQATPEVTPTAADPGRLRGSIAVEGATFRYRESGPPTLDHISLHARPGECIAITGPSGSGKSTLLNLLLRFEVPQAGSIFLDGRELSSLNITAVRRQIGVVTQDGRVMSDSIFNNITCGGLYSMDEAWEAARAAALADDIEAMPMGMHTIVSDGGTNISGGQRQRILIARALILKPSILIFDEATSTLDNHTQAVVAESLQRLKATRILVAHRLSTIRTADRIYVMEKGCIVQQGTYQQLSTVPGLFARLTQRQTA